MYDRAGVDQPQADTAVDRSDQPGEFQLQLRGVDRRLIGLQRRLERGDLGRGRIDGLFCNATRGDQRGKARVVGLRVRQLCGILGTRCRGLRELRAERARIDLRQQITGVHVLTFREGNPLQLTINARFDLDNAQRLHGADTGQRNRQISLGHLTDEHGHGGGRAAFRRRRAGVSRKEIDATCEKHEGQDAESNRSAPRHGQPRRACAVTCDVVHPTSGGAWKAAE